MSERVEYGGEVVLRSQEGGHASPAIECMDEPGEGAADVRATLDRFLGIGGEAATLDELLLKVFGSCGRNDHGDERLGRLRITVERIEGP